jgi:hypothetical protein
MILTTTHTHNLCFRSCSSLCGLPPTRGVCRETRCSPPEVYCRNDGIAYNASVLIVGATFASRSFGFFQICVVSSQMVHCSVFVSSRAKLGYRTNSRTCNRPLLLPPDRANVTAGQRPPWSVPPWLTHDSKDTGETSLTYLYSLVDSARLPASHFSPDQASHNLVVVTPPRSKEKEASPQWFP